MSALDFTARALAIRAAAQSPLSFAELRQARLPASVTRIDSNGHAAPGFGAGDYVADGAADAALMAAHPEAVFEGSAGRFFRLTGAPDGFVTPEQFGCPAYAPGVNAQPSIQQAVDYALAMGLSGVRFTQPHYELWTPLRDEAATGITLNDSPTGIPVVITGNIELVAAPGGTAFHRRKWDGSDPNLLAGTQWLPNLTFPGNPGGRWWRGGMFAIIGQIGEDRPEHYDDRPSFTLRGNWRILGGLPLSGSPGGYQGGETAYYDLRPDGSGWDMTDKALWRQDNWTGDMVLDGEIWFDGFRGEVIYIGGNRHGSFYQRGTLTISNSDADGFNPGGVWFSRQDEDRGVVDAEHIVIRKVYQAMEGGAGRGKSRIGRLEVADCPIASGLVGGGWNDALDLASPPPSLDIGFFRVERTANLRVYMNTRIGRLEMVDTNVLVGQANFETANISIGEICAAVDGKSLSEPVTFGGGATPGVFAVHDVAIGRIHCRRTKRARAEGFVFTRPIRWSGSLGDHCFVGEISGETTQSPRQATTTPDFNVGIGGHSLKLTHGSNGWNVETLGASLGEGRSWYGLTTTSTSGNFAVTLPDPAKYPAGSRIVLRHQAAASVVFSVQTAGTRMNRRMLLAQSTTVEFENETSSAWRPLTEGPRLVATSGSVELRKGGAAIPAGDVSDEHTFTVNGAKAGMTVTVTPATAISEDAQLIGRVTADNTAGIRARNMNLGAALAIGSATYRVVLEWPN